MFFKELLNDNSIFVRTTKPSYYCGEMVIGDVNLNIVAPMHIDGLLLKVKGTQKCEFDKKITTQRNVGGQTQMVSEMRHYREKQHFFRVKFDLFNASTTLIPGMYTFPFSFALPASLPGIVNVSGNGFDGEWFGKIYYKVKAEALIPHSRNLKHGQELIINELLERTLTETALFKEGNVTFLCCIPKGRASMSLLFDKNAYAPGEIVHLKMAVDNTMSKASLQSLDLKLYQHIELMAEGQREYNAFLIAKTTSGPLDAGMKDERLLSLPLPAKLSTSSKGTIVKCWYELKAELCVPWSPDITIKSYVQIYAPSMPNFVEMTAAPPSWNPTVYPSAQVVIANGVTY